MLLNEDVYSSVTSGRRLVHIGTKSIFCIISGMYDVIYNDPALAYDIYFLLFMNISCGL